MFHAQRNYQSNEIDEVLRNKRIAHELAVAIAAASGDLPELKRLKPPPPEEIQTLEIRLRSPRFRTHDLSNVVGQWSRIVAGKDRAHPDDQVWKKFDEKTSLKIEHAFKGGRTPLVGVTKSWHAAANSELPPTVILARCRLK